MDSTQVEELLTKIARRIHTLGLSGPAIALLEMHKPVRGVLHASALLFQPAIAMLFGPKPGSLLVSVCESPQYIERLIQLLESPEGLYERC